MELIWSTATFRPLKSNSSSVSLVWFSNAMWYWKPEQPPPTTATRSATGTGFCMPMISLTLVLAVGVRLIISSFGLRSQASPRCILPVKYSKPRLQLHLGDTALFSSLETPPSSVFRQPHFAYHKIELRYKSHAILAD